MATEIIHVPAADGASLAANWYRPMAHPLGITVVLSGGTAIQQAWYRHFAGWLAAQGCSVFTYDYRGIGQSASADLDPGALRMRDWGQHDFTAMIRFARAHAPDDLLVHIGHSAGGHLPALSEACGEVDLYVAVAAQYGYIGLWPWQQKLFLLPMWYGVVPATVRAKGELPGAVIGGESLPRGIALEWARWCRHPDFFVDENGKRLPRYFTQSTAPMRFYAFTDDLRFAPLAAVRELAMQFRNAQIEIVSREPQDYGQSSIGHFGFFRKHMEEVAWPELFSWILERADRLQGRMVA